MGIIFTHCIADPQNSISFDNITKYYHGYESDDACEQAAQQIKDDYKTKYGSQIFSIDTDCSQDDTQ